ncbi:3-deoxy-manno-octulosonate cytidylyltransferase [Muricoccus radiodurans]|uniref:3-deoxy-manno-octulosonate cytidylyltransferase n=1 Tax=Muricoccus radiodurans TaxID=2231721 RepID=UPI003CFB31CE
MNALVVIPARWGSTRFPGKPLAPVRGVPMLQRVWALARAAAASRGGEGRVVIATDDDRIAAFAAGLGAEAVMTDPAICNGTERAAAVLARLGTRPDLVVNLQGDAVLTPPWVVAALLEAGRDPAVRMVTPAARMSAEALARLTAAKAAGEVGGTTVVTARNGDALYFSKSIIPFRRSGAEDVPVLRHIGLYGYRPETLEALVALPMGPLERAESLEQLRALEHGIPIRVVEVDYRGRTHWGVDSEDDLRRCEALIEAEGELLDRWDGTGSARA